MKRNGLSSKIREKFHISGWQQFVEKYHTSEMIGIVAAFIMAVISGISYLRSEDISLLPAIFFFVLMMVFRLGLFIWNHFTKNRRGAEISQAAMMLVTAILLYLVRAVLVFGIFYQMLRVGLSGTVPHHTMLAVGYGLFTVGKIVLWLNGLIKKRKISRYMETLSFLGWYSAIYSIALFITYLILAGVEINFGAAVLVILIFVIVSTIVLIVLMIIKSILSFYRIHKERKRDRTAGDL